MNHRTRTVTFAVSLAAAMLATSSVADEHTLIERVKPVGELVILPDDATPAAAPAAEAAATESAATDSAVAETATSEAAPAAAEAGNGAAKQTFDTVCFACHGTGAAGAPKLDDKDNWATRIAQGKETIYSNAINGKGAMPPKGGAMNLSDDEIKAVVDYMLSQAS